MPVTLREGLLRPPPHQYELQLPEPTFTLHQISPISCSVEISTSVRGLVSYARHRHPGAPVRIYLPGQTPDYTNLTTITYAITR